MQFSLSDIFFVYLETIAGLVESWRVDVKLDALDLAQITDWTKPVVEAHFHPLLKLYLCYICACVAHGLSGRISTVILHIL